jgi:hypothetical protein
MLLQHAVAYVNQIKMPVAKEGLIIIQKRPGGESATVRGRCGVGYFMGQLSVASL